VHDIGAPVGFSSPRPGRIASLVILNTVVDVIGWTPVDDEAVPLALIGELWAAGRRPIKIPVPYAAARDR
jgi:hypothetical protein